MPVYPEATIAPGDPGALLVDTYSYEFRNFLFGSGTDFVTTKVDGLLAMPNASAEDHDKQGDHGAFPGVVLMKKRVIDFDLTIVGSAGVDIESKLLIAQRVFQVPRKRYARVLEPFVFWRPGGAKKMCLARCTKRDFTSEFKTARGMAEGSVELEAPDPLIYSLDEFSTQIIPVGGTGTAPIWMDGDYVDGAWPHLSITGPVNTALIENETDENRTIRLDLNISAAQVAIVDVQREIVWIDGVRSSIAIRSDNQWWALLPGTNTINYARQGGTDSSICTVTHRDTWQ